MVLYRYMPFFLLKAMQVIILRNVIKIDGILFWIVLYFHENSVLSPLIHQMYSVGAFLNQCKSSV